MACPLIASVRRPNPTKRDTQVPFGRRNEPVAERIHHGDGGCTNPAPVLGGAPPPALLEASMSTADFHTYVDDMCEQIGDGHRWILGVSDNEPPDTDLSRLEYLGTRFTEVASG